MGWVDCLRSFEVEVLTFMMQLTRLVAQVAADGLITGSTHGCKKTDTHCVGGSFRSWSQAGNSRAHKQRGATSCNSCVPPPLPLPGAARAVVSVVIRWHQGQDSHHHAGKCTRGSGREHFWRFSHHMYGAIRTFARWTPCSLRYNAFFLNRKSASYV